MLKSIQIFNKIDENFAKKNEKISCTNLSAITY